MVADISYIPTIILIYVLVLGCTMFTLFVFALLMWYGN